MSGMNTAVFNTHKVITGWYWALPAKQLKKGKIKAINLMNRELVLYRGQNGKITALDAYCPHMGAHLAQGRVEGNQIRCFFHRWRFNEEGNCTEIPCLNKLPNTPISIRNWPVAERYQMIWVWIGNTSPTHDVPCVPELSDQDVHVALGNRFIKNCHPNVVMINAIDEQHFRSVHKLPGSLLCMEPTIQNQYNIHFNNVGRLPDTNWFYRLISRFYAGPLTYNLSYWYGQVGTTTFGPDFLHIHLMFALRQTHDGKTEGQTIVFTKRRKGLLGWLVSKLILFLSKIGGRYFAIGDTQVFQTIRFNFKNPIVADRAVIQFIKHLEQQEIVAWTDIKEDV